MTMRKTGETTYGLDTWIEPNHTNVYCQVPPRLIYDDGRKGVNHHSSFLLSGEQDDLFQS